jgi:hypothetical protein
MKFVATALFSHVRGQSRPASILRWLVVALCLLGGPLDGQGQSVTPPGQSTESGVLIVFVRTGAVNNSDRVSALTFDDSISRAHRPNIQPLTAPRRRCHRRRCRESSGPGDGAAPLARDIAETPMIMRS